MAGHDVQIDGMRAHSNGQQTTDKTTKATPLFAKNLKPTDPHTAFQSDGAHRQYCSALVSKVERGELGELERLMGLLEATYTRVRFHSQLTCFQIVNSSRQTYNYAGRTYKVLYFINNEDPTAEPVSHCAT
jgi:hypothetical protein